MIDNTKWSEIYKKHSKKMFWVCKRYVNDASLAEDLMHEGFITAIQKQNTFSGFGSFEGWLRTIMVNTSLLYLRKNKNNFFVTDVDIPDTPTAITDMNSTTDIKNKIINTDFNQQELLEVVEAIPEHHKIVFNMFVMDKFSHDEISKALNITTNTSKSHLSRARKKIQELLLLKANEKEQKKDKKRLFFWFLFTGSYIDSIYAKGFSTFPESPSGTFNIEEVITQQSLPAKITSGHIFGVTLQKATIITVSMALIISLVLMFNGKKAQEDKDKSAVTDVANSNNAIQNAGSDVTLSQKDSLENITSKANIKEPSISSNEANALKKASQKTADQNKKKPPQKYKNKNPVVIKKIIDTVYVYK
jgi:RNA polymerase sigma factor (sigma-70 family)